MTQNTYSVSPKASACPKPGATTPRFRPADPGDTRRSLSADSLGDPVPRDAQASIRGQWLPFVVSRSFNSLCALRGLCVILIFPISRVTHCNKKL
jgi:hypothetical protein